MGSEAIILLSNSWGCYDVLVLHLFKELVCGIFVAILLHLGKVAFLWCHCSINLSGEGTTGVTFLLTSQCLPPSWPSKHTLCDWAEAILWLTFWTEDDNTPRTTPQLILLLQDLKTSWPKPAVPALKFVVRLRKQLSKHKRGMEFASLCQSLIMRFFFP